MTAIENGKITHDSEWVVYNSPLLEYQNWFSRVLNGVKIQDLISHTSSPVVVDLMAPSGTLAELFVKIKPRIIHQLGVAVSFNDLRVPEEIDRDNKLRITQVEGDIAQQITQDKIRKALQGRKADLIIERAYTGIGNLPKKYEFYIRSFQRMWDVLNVNGSMLLQFPYNKDLSDMKVDPLQFAERLRAGGILVDYSDDSQALFSAIHVKRLSESPSRLPF